MVTDEERLARMVMSKVAEPGDPDACRLVREYSAAELLDRLRSGPAEVSAKVVGWRERLPCADGDQIAAAAADVTARYVCPGDAEWFGGLDDLATVENQAGERRGGSPFGLWVRGHASLGQLLRRSLAIVGSRACTHYGQQVTTRLAFGAAEKGFTVVSGGAFGIDAAAHRSALAGDATTLAVLAGGVDRLYPAGNADLLRDVAATGLLVSEAAPGCTPSRARFLVRNRLIAAMSQGTVVVEAALRSGALNTARWALDLGRPVMGVPGPVTSMASGGVHELLRQSGAVLVTDVEEVIEHVSPVGEGLAPRKAGVVRDGDALDRTSRQVLDAVPVLRPAPTDWIARSAGVSRDEARAQLLRLQQGDLVTSGEDGWTLTRP
jgi:DNA processing protein